MGKTKDHKSSKKKKKKKKSSRSEKKVDLKLNPIAIAMTNIIKKPNNK